jgi:DNA-binding CsgD family transcriptional regulator
VNRPKIAVLIAAAEPTGELALFWRAVARLGVTDGAVLAAQDARLLILDGRVQVRHPLIRSAVYYGASPTDRRRVHRALAELTDPNEGADRIAWHRACAVADRDEDVAADLESAAERARERGGYASAAAFHTRAAELTPDPSLRCGRLLNAVEAQTAAGGVARARVLLEQAARLASNEMLRSRLIRLDCGIREVHGGSWETASVLLQASQRLVSADRSAAQETMLEAMTAALISGRFVVDTTPSVVAAATRSLFDDVSWDDLSGQLLSGLATMYLEGLESAAPAFRRVLQLVESETSSSDRALKGLRWANYAAGALGDVHAVHRISRRSVDVSIELGATVFTGWSFASLVVAELAIGSIAAAADHCADYGRLVGPGEAFGDVVCLMTSAWQGREVETRRRAAEARLSATENRQGRNLGYVEYALAVLELGCGQYEQAVEHARKASLEHMLLLRAVLLPDLIEAATHAGDPEVANQALQSYTSIAAVARTPLVDGLLARSRALVAGSTTAEQCFLQSIACLVACDAAGQVARTRLLYGEWLRRAKRRRDAREQLQAAFDHFSQDGAAAFAERARIELMATGETARKRSVETADGLTPQEAEVARIASTGSTNREIARQLFISDSTVDYHLGKVFRKLGVSSRRELGKVLIK